MKVKSKEIFLDKLNEDSSWRKFELSVMIKTSEAAKGPAKTSLIRAGVVILYSHWEGHIKEAAKLYISYLNSLGIKYQDMTRNNLSVGFLSEFHGTGYLKSLSYCNEIVDFSSGKRGNGKFLVDENKVINTKSNLQLEVLCEILDVIGINNTEFMANKVFIDEKLLRYRNSIAHGEDTRRNHEYNLDDMSYRELHEKIVELMNIFDTEILNHVVLEKFRLPVSS